MQGIRPLIVLLTLIGLIISACEKSPMTPVETFNVRAAIDISTLDMNNRPLSVPVTIKIINNYSLDNSDAIPEIITQNTNDHGRLSFLHDFTFQSGEQAEIIVDVETNDYHSIQYWTAYLTANDAPGKQFVLQMDVAEK